MRPSIDIFLSDRLNFADIGRLAIAQQIIMHENEASLQSWEDTNWLRELSKITKHNTTMLTNGKFSFITFNYDRSLEHYFYFSLKEAYGFNEGILINILRQIPIIHIYGQLDYLPWQRADEPGRSYGNSCSLEQFKKCSEGINIVYQGPKENRQLKSAQEIIAKATHIYFLGFGYDPANLDLLTIKNNIDNKRKIGGTAVGLEGEAERNRVVDYFPAEVRSLMSGGLGQPNEGITQFLRNKYVL